MKELKLPFFYRERICTFKSPLKQGITQLCTTRSVPKVDVQSHDHLRESLHYHIHLLKSYNTKVFSCSHFKFCS